MSTPAPNAAPPVPVVNAPQEVKLICHSSLFYWWPVWVFGLFMALWTVIEGHRFLAVPADTVITETKNEVDEKVYTISTKSNPTKPLSQAVAEGKPPIARVSHHAWLGTVYWMILILTIFITNVPLRGLWSFVAIMGVVVLSLLVTLFHGWDVLFEKVADLKVYTNLAAYLLLSISVLILWATATFGFDRRTYVLFKPGQIQLCEHIGSAVQTFDTYGVSFEKQRDDLFRHYILGFGSGDLILKGVGPDKREVRLPNILGIGWKLKTIEDLLREKTMAGGS